MMLSVGFNYVVGLDIARQQAAKRRRSAQLNLLLAVVVNLFLLGFFKYSGFLIDTLNAMFSLQLTYKPVSYTHLDVYKRQGYSCASIVGCAAGPLQPSPPPMATTCRRDVYKRQPSRRA